MLTLPKRLSLWAVVIALLLLIPLALTIRDGGIEGVGWNWTAFDFVFMGTLMFGSALVFELVSSRMGSSVYKYAVGLAVVTAFLLVWVNAAVGIIGSEDNPANALFFVVLLIGMGGAFLSRLKPLGMSNTLFAMAVAHFLVPVIAFIAWRPDFSPGVVQVFTLNMVYVMLWMGSGLLFRQAAEKNVA